MSDEAFPNSEQLFKQAFATADPAPALLKLLREHPIYDTVQELVIYYTEAVEEQPLRGKLLASTLARVSVSPDAPNFETDPLASLIDRELADQHFKVIHGNTEVKEYGPKNTYLLDSLLSGLSLKYNLTSTSDQLAAIDDGLDTPSGSEKAELLVVGACIQLLFYGSKIVTDEAGSYKKKASTVAQKLKDHKVAGTVKNPHAVQVLELTISNAEAGFKPEDDREDAWDLLFPAEFTSR
ncbi:hypothetical protein CPB83DRAFT_848738 [Crepidotus variabilis]|uniref:Uncharacterized protein n=1 Tax=Crepidotus variabilis TaxID=179855 RepID=A0A9P6EMH8_9AGAR|nr:hypothetical protein CPB83DRAFT_848738 [Crepidotus variabilis]